MWLIVVGYHGLNGRIPLVPSIGAKVLELLGVRFWAVQNGSVQGGFQQLHIMHVCAAGDERQRDATRVDLQTSFAAIFSAGPRGWALRILVPEELFQGPVDALPLPADALHPVVFGQSRLP